MHKLGLSTVYLHRGVRITRSDITTDTRRGPRPALALSGAVNKPATVSPLITTLAQARDEINYRLDHDAVRRVMVERQLAE